MAPNVPDRHDIGRELKARSYTTPRDSGCRTPNAPLNERHRLKLARLIVEQGWPIARAAERYDVSLPTAKR